MKYIDAEKLLSEIERRKKQDITIRERSILIDIETAINTLQQERPSLPSNLDEAVEIAKELAYKTWSDGENWGDAAIKTFKAAVEWMTGQGATMEITDDTEWADLDSFVHKNVTGGSIIQIRKK